MYKKLILAALLVWSFLLTAACPVKKADLVTMKKFSGRIATGSLAAVKITEKLYDEKIVSLAVKDEIADAIILLAKGGQFADAQLDQAIAEYGTTPVPANIRAQLVKLFRSNILDKFLDVLEKLKIANVSDRFRQSIASIKTAVLVIANLLDVRAETEKLIQEKSR